MYEQSLKKLCRCSPGIRQSSGRRIAVMLHLMIVRRSYVLRSNGGAAIMFENRIATDGEGPFFLEWHNREFYAVAKRERMCFYVGVLKR